MINFEAGSQVEANSLTTMHPIFCIHPVTSERKLVRSVIPKNPTSTLLSQPVKDLTSSPSEASMIVPHAETVTCQSRHARNPVSERAEQTGCERAGRRAGGKFHARQDEMAELGVAETD